MVKKLLALTLGLVMAMGLNAQSTDSAIDTADILFWVGEGDDYATFILDLDGHTFAWGYRFDAADEPTAFDMVMDIDQADPRFVVGTDWTTYTYVYTYVEWPLKLAVNELDARFKVNGTLAEEGDALYDYDVENGTVLRISDDEADVWTNAVSAATVAALPVDTKIAAADVKYWVGEGENQAVVVFDWTSNGRALAWGLRFGEEGPNVDSAFRMVADADPRLSFDLGANTYSFEGPFTHLQTAEGFLQFMLDDNPYTGTYDVLQNGSFLKVGESGFATGWDSTEYAGSWYPSAVVWNTRIDPVGAPFDTVNATIAASDIKYWVGEGAYHAILAFNWAGRSLAWGYRFDGESVVLNQAMNAIHEADSRFSFTADGGYLGDILFVQAANDTLKGTSYWEQSVNGVMGMGLTQELKNGDLNLWADPAAGVKVDSVYYDGWGWSYFYRYPMTIEPVAAPVGIQVPATVSVTVYPNPVSEVLNVTFDALAYDFQAVLYDLSGRLLMSRTVAAGTDRLSFATDALPDGVYILNLGGSATRVVVRH